MLLALTACGKLSQQQSASSIVGDASPGQKSEKGGALYQQYKGEFPNNLMEITPEELVDSLPVHQIVMAGTDTKVTYVVTTKVAQEVIERVDAAYPEYDPEDYANEVTEDFIKDHPAFTNMIMNGADAPEVDKIDMTE